MAIEGLIACVAPDATFYSDDHRHYPVVIKRHFLAANHQIYPSKRSRSGDQGELKRIGFDPLFSINHTLAMLRANMNRLIRRTWCTSKRIDRLVDHLTLYADYHNRVLIKEKTELIADGHDGLEARPAPDLCPLLPAP